MGADALEDAEALVDALEDVDALEGALEDALVAGRVDGRVDVGAAWGRMRWRMGVVDVRWVTVHFVWGEEQLITPVHHFMVRGWLGLPHRHTHRQTREVPPTADTSIMASWQAGAVMITRTRG